MKIKLILLCLFLSLTTVAQIVSVSDELIVRNDLSYQVLGTMDEHTLLFRDRTPKFEVQAFNEKLRATWKKEILLDKRRPKIIDIVADKESFCVFYLFKRKSETLLKAHKYDAKANLIDSVVVKNFENVFYSPDLETLASPSKSKIVFYEVKEREDVAMLSFDIKRMKVLWEHEYINDVSRANKHLREILTTNKGDFFLIYERDNKPSKLATHRFEIQHNNGLGINQIEIPMPEFLHYDVLFEYDNLNNRLVAGGLYTDNNTSFANGYFYLNYSPDGDSVPIKEFHLFTDEFIYNVMEKGEKSRNKSKNKGIDESDIREIVLRRDGGIILVGEQNRHLDRGYGSARNRSNVNRNFGNRYTTDYYYEDLFVISLNPDGSTHWADVLYKNQFSQDDDAIFSSYFLLKTPMALRFLFNDEIQYENTVSEYVLKGDGTYTRNSVMNTQNQRLRLRFKDATQLAKNEIIVPSETRNRLKLVRIVY